MSNVVLLMSDEHNPFYSSVYGHRSIQTPNMERLAERGTVFQNAYCPSPLCAPSRSAFMAGKRVHSLQTYSNSAININPNHLSYGAALVAGGVHVTLIGKTDVYDKAEKLGFSEVIVPKETHWPDVDIGRDPLMILPNAAERADRFGVDAAPWDLDLMRMDKALTWLTETAPTLDTPWVLVVNLNKPHFPHYASQELWDLYPDGGDLPTYGREEDSAHHPHAQDLRAFFSAEAFSDEQTRGLRRGYLGCVTFIDQQIGRIAAALAATEAIENTNLIYTSDHGEMLGKFGMWWKCSLYEDSVRVPCIAAGPDFAAGKTVETPVDLLDVQATLFKAVDVDRPSSWVGQPLQDIPTNDPDRIIFSEYHGHGARASAYMVRKGDWKYIFYCAGPNQLFNLAHDPDELHNFIETNPDIARELEKALRDICSPEVEHERAERFIRG